MSNKLLLSLILILVFHITGIIGMLGDQPGFFVRNTPLNLVLSALLLLLNHKKWLPLQVLALAVIFAGGFFVEVIGVNTGLLFGDYYYGRTLGPKLFGVPIVIGVNWMMQVYIAGNIAGRLPVNDYLKAASGSVLMVFLDYFIEPVAMHFDYWQWENNIIPVTNYVCWMVISFLFLSLFFKSRFREYNPLSGVLYLVQLVMFIILGREL